MKISSMCTEREQIYLLLGSHMGNLIAWSAKLHTDLNGHVRQLSFFHGPAKMATGTVFGQGGLAQREPVDRRERDVRARVNHVKQHDRCVVAGRQFRRMPQRFGGLGGKIGGNEKTLYGRRPSPLLHEKQGRVKVLDETACSLDRQRGSRLMSGGGIENNQIHTELIDQPLKGLREGFFAVSLDRLVNFDGNRPLSALLFRLNRRLDFGSVPFDRNDMQRCPVRSSEMDRLRQCR